MSEDGHNYVFGNWPLAPWKRSEKMEKDNARININVRQIRLDPVDLTDFDVKAMKTRGTFKLSADMSVMDVKTAALIFAYSTI